MKKEIVLERFLTQRPQPFKVASSNIQLQGVVLRIDDSGKCQELTTLRLSLK
jgi:calcineurin-like phosphoesterase